jgi:hypothetical protein
MWRSIWSWKSGAMEGSSSILYARGVRVRNSIIINPLLYFHGAVIDGTLMDEALLGVMGEIHFPGVLLGATGAIKERHFP